MTSIDNIIDCRGMVERRQQLHAEIDKLIARAWRCVRVAKSKSGEYVPIFAGPEMDDIATGLEGADKRVTELEADAAEISKLVEGFQSIAEMARAKNAAANAIQHAESGIRKAMQTAIAQGVAPEDLRESEVVKEAELRRDSLVAEKGSMAEDLTVRLQKAKAILDRYPPGASQ